MVLSEVLRDNPLALSPSPPLDEVLPNGTICCDIGGTIGRKAAEPLAASALLPADDERVNVRMRGCVA